MENKEEWIWKFYPSVPQQKPFPIDVCGVDLYSSEGYIGTVKIYKKNRLKRFFKKLFGGR